MELQIIRFYTFNGVNGMILYDGMPIAYSIELPWKENHTGVSCIPEGRYQLKKRYSLKFGWHLWVINVPGRELILMHAANDALRELRGCIGVVTHLTGVGRGEQSRAALKGLTGLVFAAIARKQSVYLTIKSNDHEPGTGAQGLKGH